jgi:cardiolipin synthase A/B
MSLFRRKRKRFTLRSPRFSLRFRRNTEASCGKGNRVEFLRNGGDFLSALFAAIDSAARSVHLEFYIIKNDVVGNAFADALLGAAARGAEVCLIYDYVGCFETPGTYFRRLEKGGVRCLAFNPPSFRKGLAWFDKRDHRKMALIDGRTAFVGGINIASEYAGYGESLKRWRDVGVRIDGPTVTLLERFFRSVWGEEGGDIPSAWEHGVQETVPEGEDEVMIVNGGPHHNRSFIRSAFRMAMAGATESIRIVNPYFIPGPRVIRSLLKAAGRGVDVQVILPARSDVPLVRLVSRSSYAILLKGGVKIYEREGTILHAKVMLIDDCWAVVGSANLDQRSFHRNFEMNVIVDSHSFGSQVAAMFTADLASSRRIELADHERRGLFTRLLERLFKSLSWFL